MTTFTRRAVQILSEEWERWSETSPPKEYLKSKVIYERLVAEGWDVPDNALNDSWETEQIRGPRFLGRDGWRMHGNRRFMWVNPGILDDTLYLGGDNYQIL